MSWHGIDIEVMCWSHRQRFGPDRDAESTAFDALVGYCGTRSSAGRYVVSMLEAPFPTGRSREETARILDYLADRLLVRWNDDPESGGFTVELLPGVNPAVTAGSGARPSAAYARQAPAGRQARPCRGPPAADDRLAMPPEARAGLS